MTATLSDDNTIGHPSPQIDGLTNAEVQERFRLGQVNRFEAQVGRSYWQIFRYNIFNVFNVILFLMLLIVLLSQEYTTVLFAGFSVVMNSVVGTFQEINARRKLKKLADLAAQTVRVRRDGQTMTLHPRQIVQDEVIVITPGDRLPVDGELIASDSLEIDESHLTGESDAVYKSLGEPLFSGSFCIAGTGMMTATRIGRSSTINRLAAIAKVYKNTLTPTQRKISAIVQLSMALLFILGPMLMISGHLRGVPFIEIIKDTVVFATSLVAQGLILVTILSLTIGAVKISRHQTVIQRVNAVESLANVTVLCFDKTGTMTQNRLVLNEIRPLNDTELGGIKRHLRRYIDSLSHQNSTATAISQGLPISGENMLERVPKVREIPFNSQRKWGAIEYATETLILGAPERVLGEHNRYAQQVRVLSEQGLRVLALARVESALSGKGIPATVQPLALITVSDQIRHDIKETLDAFRAQEVTLKVISGDRLGTVCAIARQAGVPTAEAYTGDQLKEMADSDLELAAQKANVFARIEPDTKRRIVAALRRQGEYVAMVGDGVNDVPAMKEADLAIAMNDGAQITKDISDIVLLNNALSTLPLAFHEGELITQTLYGTMKMFLTKNVYNTLFFIFALFMAMPFPISPIQISWASFGTVNIPAALLAVGIVRPEHIRNFRDDVLDYVITSGVVGAIGLALLYLVTRSYTGGDLMVARSAVTVFITLYGLMIAWNILGIDPLRPHTIVERPFGMILTSVLSGITWIVALSNVEVFDFWWPPVEIFGLIAVIFALCLPVVSVGMQNRGLLHRTYTLFER
jgi:cation-transporting P-type ATPase E